MKVFAVDVPMLKVAALFVLDCTYDELRAYLHRRFKVRVEPEPDTIAGRMLTFERPPYRVVWARQRELPVVLHEVFHLVTRICADKGIVIRAHNERGENDDETAAYLFECLARQAIRKCR